MPCWADHSTSFIGVDIHKHTHTTAALSATGAVPEHPRVTATARRVLADPGATKPTRGKPLPTKRRIAVDPPPERVLVSGTRPTHG